MPPNRVNDGSLHSRQCLLYPLKCHPLRCYKTLATLVQGIRKTVRRHPYIRTPYFAMSRWQFAASKKEDWDFYSSMSCRGHRQDGAGCPLAHQATSRQPGGTCRRDNRVYWIPWLNSQHREKCLRIAICSCSRCSQCRRHSPSCHHSHQHS